MTSPIFEVIKVGLSTTFQDFGRYGYQRFGVVTSGVMDRYSYQIANFLVGNPLNSVCLEIGVNGPILEIKTNATFAICGANLSPQLNGEPIPCWKTFHCKTGDILSFGRPLEGNYAYIAVSGGFLVEKRLGSSSTYMKAGIGQLISNGDILYGNPRILKRNRGLSGSSIPSFPNEITVRYVPGPHLSYFKEQSINLFEQQPYIFNSGDRMGIRLKAMEPIDFQLFEQLPSDPIPFGAIQIPPNGQPIVLLADRQTTGGYPRIGTVISTDIPLIAQLQLNGKVSFKSITIEKAQLLTRIKHKQFLIWKKCNPLQT